MMKTFIGSCVSNPFDDIETLCNVIDGWKEITKQTFLRNCDVQDGDDLYFWWIKKLFNQYKNDFQFYKSWDIYFYVNSAIEYFYK